MTVSGSQLQPVAKADIGKRLVAGFIDGVLCLLVSSVPGVGILVGIAYLLVRDGLEFSFMERRSIGKQLMKLRPVRNDGRPMDIATSFHRNALLAVGPLGALLMAVPLLGWLLGFLIGAAGLVIGVIEVLRIFSDPGGRRLGDDMAETCVLEVGA